MMRTIAEGYRVVFFLFVIKSSVNLNLKYCTFYKYLFVKKNLIRTDSTAVVGRLDTESSPRLRRGP